MHRSSRFVFLLICFVGCSRNAADKLPAPAVQPGAVASPVSPIEAPGLHNVLRVTDKLLSGSCPEGEAGFQSLEKLHVKTIISVDGMRPDLERAHKYGLRYVHIPIGYDGVPREQGLKMAKATRDLPGLVYIHCHHGQHRGPASAAVIQLLLDPSCTVEHALAEMRRAGTDAKYVGLYAAPMNFRKGPAPNLDLVSSDFPEAAKAEGLTEIMVHVDEHWDRIKLMKASGWKTPASHADGQSAT